MKQKNKKTIFSGVQPSGTLHIGNYSGAISQWVDLQKQYNCIFCVVDYHAITVKQDPKKLRQNVIDVAKVYLASGIHPEKSIIFQQSDVPEHTELAWILNCVANAGELKRMKQFNDKIGIVPLHEQKEEYYKFLQEAVDKNVKLMIKNEKNIIEKKYSLDKFDKVKNQKDKFSQLLNELVIDVMEVASDSTKKYFNEGMENLTKRIDEENNKFNRSNVGLFDYPVLMAADILLYDTDAVPVGDDQAQHVELCRTLARRFNTQFGETFVVPELIIRKEGARIMGLDDPTKKMSKSATSSANYIALTDDPEIAAKKITRAVTDSGSEIKYDIAKKPAISNLLTIYSLLSGQTVKEIENKYRGKGYGEFKKDLAQITAEFLVSFQKKYYSFKNEEIEEILKHGAEKIRPIARETISKVKEKMGIIKN